MKRLPKLLYQPYKWLVVGPCVVLATAILGTLCIFTSIFFGRDAADRLAVVWSRICCFIVPIKVNLNGKENYNIQNAYVVVANHQSMVDIIILHGWLGLKIKWIMKKELEKVPLFGLACKKLGCIYVDRNNREAAIVSMQEAQKKLTSASSVIFFPEGTRSREGSLLPFKKGAFRFAMDTGLPILPVTIKDSIKILPSGSLDLFPGTAHIFIHPPIEMKNRQIEEIDPIIIMTQKKISINL